MSLRDKDEKYGLELESGQASNLTRLQAVERHLEDTVSQTQNENSIGQMTWFLPQIHDMKKTWRKMRKKRERTGHVQGKPTTMYRPYSN